MIGGGRSSPSGHSTTSSQLSCYTKPRDVTLECALVRVWTPVSRLKIAVLVLVLHAWSWRSVADLGVIHDVHAVLVLNSKFHHRKLIQITITRYSKLRPTG